MDESLSNNSLSNDEIIAFLVNCRDPIKLCNIANMWLRTFTETHRASDLTPEEIHSFYTIMMWLYDRAIWLEEQYRYLYSVRN